MTHAPTVATVMTPFPHAMDSEASLADARAMMRQQKIRHLPVMKGETLVAVLGEDDSRFVHAPSDATIASLDLPAPFVVDLHARLDLVLDRMARDHLDAALIERHGKLAGIITIADVCTAFAKHLREHFPPPDDVA